MSHHPLSPTPASSGRRTIFLIVLLLLFTGASIFLRGYHRELSGDELYYMFVWEPDDDVYLWDNDHRFERQVETFGDIVTSQIQHYRYANGRSLVHAAEQFFTTIAGVGIFAVFNALVFILFTWLVVRFTAPPAGQCNYLFWLLTVIGLLYLFPFPFLLWISINLAPNYLWPGALTMATLLAWRRIDTGDFDMRYRFPLALLAFVTGWSNEAYVVGLGGGMFFYYCFHFKRLKRPGALWLVIPLWLGAAIMVVAPGNLMRFFADGGAGGTSVAYKSMNMVRNLLMNPCTYLFAVILVAGMFLKSRSILRIISSTPHLVYVFVVSLLFLSVANTGPQTFTFLILIIFLWIMMWIGKMMPVNTVSAGTVTVSILLTVVFVFHQLAVIRDTERLQQVQHAAIVEYMDSDDGVVCLDQESVGTALTKPFLHMWSYFNRTSNTARSISASYSGYSKPFIGLSAADYEVVTAPSRFFIPANRYPGTAGAYQAPGGKWIWMNPDEYPGGDAVAVDLEPVGWNHHDMAPLPLRVKFALFPDSYPGRDIVRVDTLHTVSGDLLRIPYRVPRHARAINAIDR